MNLNKRIIRLEDKQRMRATHLVDAKPSLVERFARLYQSIDDPNSLAKGASIAMCLVARLHQDSNNRLTPKQFVDELRRYVDEEENRTA